MKLMWPRLRNISIIYLIVGIVFGGLVLLISKFPIAPSLLTLIMLVPGVCYYVAPALATTSINALQFSLLPATSGEKLAALSLYGIVILPTLCYLLPQLTALFTIHSSWPELYSISAGIYRNPVSILTSSLSGVFPLIACLYFSLRNPGKRWMPAFVGFLFACGIGLISGIYAGVRACRLGYQGGFSGIDMIDQQELAMLVMDDVKATLPFIAVASLLISIWLAVLCYRRIARRQL